MADCLNHPWIESHAACSRCGQPFCDSCLVELLGNRLCAPCRNVRLAEVQGFRRVTPIYAGTGTIALGRWLAAGWNIAMADLLTWGLATIVTMFAMSCSCYGLAGPLICGMLMMAFRKMSYGAIAIDNLFDGFKRFLWAFLAFLMIGAVYLVLYLGLYGPVYGYEIWQALRPNYVPSMGMQFGQLGYNFGVQFLIGTLLWCASVFVFPHIAVRNVNPVEAFSASWQVQRRNPMGFLLFGFVMHLIYFLSSIGIYACLLGPLLGYPLLAGATAQAYADHFEIEGYDRV